MTSPLDGSPSGGSQTARAMRNTGRSPLLRMGCQMALSCGRKLLRFVPSCDRHVDLLVEEVVLTGVHLQQLLQHGAHCLESEVIHELLRERTTRKVRGSVSTAQLATILRKSGDNNPRPKTDTAASYPYALVSYASPSPRQQSRGHCHCCRYRSPTLLRSLSRSVPHSIRWLRLHSLPAIARATTAVQIATGEIHRSTARLAVHPQVASGGCTAYEVAIGRGRENGGMMHRSEEERLRPCEVESRRKCLFAWMWAKSRRYPRPRTPGPWKQRNN